jgi:hypothetical protein
MLCLLNDEITVLVIFKPTFVWFFITIAVQLNHLFSLPYRTFRLIYFLPFQNCTAPPELFTVRRTVYQCHKYGRLLTINDAAQFNVSFRSSMTHTNCWLYLMYYQTWHVLSTACECTAVRYTNIRLHTLGLFPCHPFPPPFRRHTLYPTTMTVNTKYNKLMLTSAHIAVLLNWLTELQLVHKHLCWCLFVRI